MAEQVYYNLDAVVLAPMKLTPRTWLACERTLLAWLHLATILAAVATGVTYYHSYAPGLRLCAILLLVPAILFILYATRQFYQRMHQLKHRQLSATDDRWGPFWLTVVMCFAVALNLVRGMWTVLAPPKDSFDYSNFAA